MNNEEILLRLVELRKNAKKLGIELNDALAIEEAIKEIDHLRPTHLVRYYEKRERPGVIDMVPRCACFECGKELNPTFADFINYCPYCGREIKNEGKE